MIDLCASDECRILLGIYFDVFTLPEVIAAFCFQSFNIFELLKMKAFFSFLFFFIWCVLCALFLKTEYVVKKDTFANELAH